MDGNEGCELLVLYVRRCCCLVARARCYKLVFWKERTTAFEGGAKLYRGAAFWRLAVNSKVNFVTVLSN